MADGNEPVAASAGAAACYSAADHATIVRHVSQCQPCLMEAATRALWRAGRPASPGLVAAVLRSMLWMIRSAGRRG